MIPCVDQQNGMQISFHQEAMIDAKAVLVKMPNQRQGNFGALFCLLKKEQSKRANGFEK